MNKSRHKIDRKTLYLAWLYRMRPMREEMRELIAAAEGK